MNAVKNNDRQMVDFLLRRGAAKNKTDRSNKYAIEYASDPENIRLFIKNNSDIKYDIKLMR